MAKRFLIVAFLTISVLMVPFVAYADDWKTELLDHRTEYSKTYSLGGDRYNIVYRSVPIHYKDNYSDPSEQWKNIDLGIVDGRITSAPYVMTLIDGGFSFVDKKTGKSGSIVLDGVSDENLKYKIVPYSRGVSFRYELDPVDVPFVVSYRVSGNVDIVTSARDDLGGLEMQVTYEDGILTERIDAVIGADGEPRDPVGKILIDPTLEIQPADKDNWNEQNDPNTNNGASIYLTVGDRTSYLRHSLIEMDLSAIDPSATIDDADLDLYYGVKADTDPVGKTMMVYKLTRTDWSETQSNWTLYKTGSSWSTAGGDYVTSSPSGASAVVPAGYGWMNWDITDIVDDAHGNSDPLEMLIRFQTEGVGGYSRLYFYSSDYAVDTDLCPKATIYYTAPSPPDPPTNVVITQITIEAINISWTEGANTDNTEIYGRYTSGDWYLLYQSDGETCNITGLDLNSTVYGFFLQGVNAFGTSNQTAVYQIGGDDLEIELDLSFYMLLGAIAFTLMALMFKRALFYLVVIACMIGLVVDPLFNDTWFQTGCVLVMIWAGLAFLVKMAQGGEQG